MKKTNNGFSLVELIIVIAIMAILIGVLAPQYLKYVEKSKISRDESVANDLYKIASTIAADPDFNDKVSADDYIIFNTAGIATNNNIIKDEILPEYLSGWAGIRIKSKKYASQTYTVKFVPTGNGERQAFSAGWSE